MSPSAKPQSPAVMPAVTTVAPKTKTTTTEHKKLGKVHRRSRSGCFTCRLRRKKCEEGKPECKACRHLGLQCDYARPIWWGTAEQRRQHKEIIKAAIKKSQLSKKAASHAIPDFSAPRLSSAAPPSLCSAPTASDPFTSHPHSRSSASPSADWDPYLFSEGLVDPSACFPLEVDVKTEHHVLVNGDNWVSYPWSEPEFVTEPKFFPEPPVIEGPSVEHCDLYLHNQFLETVQPLLFPILDLDQPDSASGLILPSLESNSAYRHCCLSAAAVHLKATRQVAAELIDPDISRHRYAAVSELCNALEHDNDHTHLLDATLGMIFFKCSVGRHDENLMDIPWHQHFQAAVNLIGKLDLPISSPVPTSMSLAAWIDIIGATMLGQAPAFADSYRNLNLVGGSAGLSSLMGCDDSVMFIISEIACLDATREFLAEEALCAYVETLGHAIDDTEPGPGAVQGCFTPTGSIRADQLRINVTALFRLAARIYLCSLVPGFDPRQESMCRLVASFTDLLTYIPEGPLGFDRSLAWPFLITGAQATNTSSFRAVLNERCRRMGDAAHFGSFGRVRQILHDVWHSFDATGSPKRWQDVMRDNGWDDLLI
ncbi:hypothetical protein K470DRAFT_226270 [Piedraia hortae CBS 480.64]|uniref:Zn(2)-C6 fungal-type domain-containing protein n=1 Tax=Piedraia hortae CBS 480.64 TaxID=1314780 RepID=A0A6A7C842_9PEZI|nr:hypothetical protein K470DRAFT_226270 [Piedraia hortae CBS 480.64]